MNGTTKWYKIRDLRDGVCTKSTRTKRTQGVERVKLDFKRVCCILLQGKIG